jgi:transposase
MKKLSTAATKQSRNFSQQTLTIGLDLGDRNSWYCVLDETGQIRLEQRVRTSAKALQEVFGEMPRSRIAPAGLGRPPRPKQHCACERT